MCTGISRPAEGARGPGASLPIRRAGLPGACAVVPAPARETPFSKGVSATLFPKEVDLSERGYSRPPL